MRLVIAAVLLASAPAHAEHEQAFAGWHKVDVATVKDVRGFKLTGGDFTDVWIGRFPDATYTMAGVVLLRCDAGTCQGRRVSFGAAEKIDVLGVVDLEGAPSDVPRGKRRDAKLHVRGKFPVLVLQTEEGTPKLARIKLHLISLVEADRGSVVMHDIAYESGTAGHTRSYKLERPELKDPKAPKDAPRDPDAPRDLKAPLELLVVEKRHDKRRCPDPLEYSYKLDGRHFRAAELISPKPACTE